MCEEPRVRETGNGKRETHSAMQNAPSACWPAGSSIHLAMTVPQGSTIIALPYDVRGAAVVEAAVAVAVAVGGLGESGGVGLDPG